MYNGLNVSLKTVLWKVMNNPLASDLSYDLAAEYAIEAIRLIGAPFVYEAHQTPVPITIEQHKGRLPGDIIEVTQIKATIEDEEAGETYYQVALQYATDSFHPNCEDTCITEATYTLENGIITTSFKTGEVTIAYKRLGTDADGFPLVPNEQKTLLAIEYYILYRFLEPLYLLGKISDKAFNSISQNKDWYMGASNTSMRLSGPDHLEAVMNTVNRLIVNTNAHKRFFKNSGQKERIKRYN